jgi:hypothetical protein
MMFKEYAFSNCDEKYWLGEGKSLESFQFTKGTKCRDVRFQDLPPIFLDISKYPSNSNGVFMHELPRIRDNDHASYQNSQAECPIAAIQTILFNLQESIH